PPPAPTPFPSTTLFRSAAATAAEPGRTPGGGLTPDREAELAQRHDGFLGALAPENLAKPRPKPPFDLTGTWFVNLRRSFADFRLDRKSTRLNSSHVKNL